MNQHRSKHQKALKKNLEKKSYVDVLRLQSLSRKNHKIMKNKNLFKKHLLIAVSRKTRKVTYKL